MANSKFSWINLRKYLRRTFWIPQQPLQWWRRLGSKDEVKSPHFFQERSISPMSTDTKVSSSSEADVKDRTSSLSPQDNLHALREMLRIRRMEERAAKLYREGKFGGFCHLVIGQEAVAIGTIMAKNDDDDVLTTYRDHGLALACGMTPVEILGELLGKTLGCSKGRGGSMHMFDREKHFHGGHGIVGAHIPLGAGFAFANKYQKNGRASICFLGDGAVPNGNFHEALNLAGLWKLPYVVVIENNEFGMGTPISRSNAIEDMYKRADGYNMHGILCDGMDFHDVYSKMSEALELARGGKPVLIEARTYRYTGHSMSDPVHGHYRTKEEIDKAKSSDCIARLSAKMIENGDLTEDDYKALDKEISNEMKAAVEESLAGEDPSTDDVYDYIYANPEGMIPGF
jgi:pyruvate dehydrogenase E1 component alpha subunit